MLVGLSAWNTPKRTKNPDWLYAVGKAALEAQRWDAALNCFEALAARHPDYRHVEEKLTEARYRVGVACLEGGAYERAISALRPIISVSQDTEQKLAEALDRSVVCVPAGEFIMGSDKGDSDGRPQRLIYLDGFEIDRYEVTNIQYARFLIATDREPPNNWPGRYLHLIPHELPEWHGTAYPSGQGMHPVVAVSWRDADDYCNWSGKRLPTEAEWEKAARGTDGRAFPWGDAWGSEIANTRMSGVGFTQPVGSYPAGASPYGALDMAGNVWEWVADLYDREYYSYAPARNPQGPTDGWGERILRGGAWDSWPAQARTSYRNATHFFGPNLRVGFRCAQ